MTLQENLSSAQIETEAWKALEDFLTPARNQPSDSEQAVLEQASLFSVPFGTIDLQAFCWGTGATVLLVHGWGGYGLQLSRFVHPLIQAGYRVLMFDAPAHGRTAGVQTSGVEIAKAILTMCQHESSIAGVIAHSLGAASTTLALKQGLQAQKVVYLGATCSLSNAAATFARRARLSKEVEAAFRKRVEARFGENVWQIYSVDRAAQLSMPALLFHDRGDREVLFEESQAIVQAWSGAKLIETSGLGHRRILRNETVIHQAVKFLTSD